MNHPREAEDSTTAIDAEANTQGVTADAREHPPSQEATLRQQAREALRAGRVPSCKAQSVWGGPGSGAVCAICGKQVSGKQLGFELEFAAGADGNEPITRYVHIPCFAAWEFECQSVLQGGGEIGTICGRDGNATSNRECR